MKLFIKQKVFSLGDKYTIFNESEHPVFTVESEVFTLGAKIHLFDALGNELYYIEKKLFRFLPEYELYSGGVLVAVVKKEFTFFKPKLYITSPSFSYTLEGDIFSMDFSIHDGQRTVGEISKRWLSFGDSYELYVYDDKDAALFSALVIAIDNCLHNESRD